MGDATMGEAGVMPRTGRPRGIIYKSLAPLGMQAIDRDIRFYPTQSGTYSFSGQNTIQIPIVGSTGFLDAENSYLHFKVTNACTNANGGAPAFIDESVFSLFNRFRIIGSMGDEVERIDRFNKLVSVLASYNMTPAHRQTLASATSGFSADAVGPNGSPEMARPGVLLKAGGVMEFTIPLISGLFGQEKYIPLGIIRGAGLRLEFLLEDPALCMQQVLVKNGVNAFFTPTANSYTISDVYYTGHIVEFEGVNVNQRLVAVMEADKAPLIMRGISFENTTTNGTGAASDDTHLFNLRARSMKAIISVPDVADQLYTIVAGCYGASVSAQSHTMVLAQETAVQTWQNPLNAVGTFTAAQVKMLFPCISCRPSYNITDVQYTIGNLQFPPQYMSVEADAQGFAGGVGNLDRNLLYRAPQFQAEAQKCFNRFNNTSASSTVARHNYAVTYGILAPKTDVIYPSGGLDTISEDISDWRVLSGEVISKFAICMNTDSFLHDQSILDSGFDTASQGLSIVLRTRSTQGGTGSGGNGGIQLINNHTTGALGAAEGNFSFSMLHWIMKEVFYEIDLNGQVIQSS